MRRFPSNKPQEKSNAHGSELFRPYSSAGTERAATLSPDNYERAKAAISGLAQNPRPEGCRKLVGRDGWRIRVGDYRVVYEIDDTARIVLILHIGHRRDIYR